MCGLLIVLVLVVASVDWAAIELSVQDALRTAVRDQAKGEGAGAGGDAAAPGAR